MMHWQEFHFIRPWWLLALLPLALLLYLLAIRKLGRRSWEQVCDQELLPYVLIGRTALKQRSRLIAVGLCGLLTILALAGPTWERLPQPVYRSGSHLVILLDLSLSMYATDLKPNRLTRARFEISDLLKNRREGDTGLIAYAGDAFVVTPLTDDTNTIDLQLEALTPQIMPVPGSNTKKALLKARNLFRQAGAANGNILIITDGIDVHDTSSTIQQLAREGYQTSILGIGTKDGTPIALPEGDFLKDANGNIVVPKLDRTSLQQLAEAGHGLYLDSRVDDQDSQQLEKYFQTKTIQKNTAPEKIRTDTWQDFGPWLVLLIIPLAAAGFRRGLLLILCFLILPHMEPAQAFEWNELWLNQDQRARQALEQNNPQQASKLFHDPDWKAAADYRAKNYASTDSLLKDKTDARSLYNRANALARQGNYEAAIKAYDQALDQDPKNNDARYNRELVKKALQQQKQQQQQNKQNSQQKKNQQQSGQGKQNQPDQSGKQQDKSSQGKNKTNNNSAKNNAGDKQKNNNTNETDSQKPNQTSKDAKQDQARQNQQGKDKDSGQQNTMPNSASQNGKQQQQPPAGQQPLAASDQNKPLDEQEQANEQWLRRIPDDPAGLLRRKFRYQYEQEHDKEPTPKQYW